MKQEDIVQAMAQLQRAKASEQNAQKQVAYTRIIAPRAGVVVKKYVDPGSIVSAGKSSFAGSGTGVGLVDIADISRMWAMVNVDETDIAQIENGQEVDITADAYPDELFTGKVIKIAPQAVVDQSVTSVPVTIELDAPDKRLRPNMNVTCEFITGRATNVLMVPNEAVKESDDGATVTVMEKGKLVTRLVEAGLVGPDNTEIKSGLSEGDKVVTATIGKTKITAPPGMGPGMGGGPPPGPPPGR
jgi:HlyD family secretion protein